MRRPLVDGIPNESVDAVAGGDLLGAEVLDAAERSVAGSRRGFSDALGCGDDERHRRGGDGHLVRSGPRAGTSSTEDL